MAAPTCMIFIIFSEEESGLGRWPEPDDRQTMVKEVNGFLSLFLELRYYWLIILSLFVAIQILGSSGAGAENPRLFRGGMNRAPPRLLSLCGIAIYPPRSITVLLGLLPAVEKTQAARTKPRKQLAWDHMPSVERP